MISRFERFSTIISAISRYWHKIATDTMEAYGLKGTYALYLVTISRFEEGITSTVLADICSKDKSDVSRAVSAMESKGLIKRNSVNKNAYRALLTLTDDGIKVVDQIKELADIAVSRASSGLSDADREIFYTAIELIADNLQTISENGLIDG